MDILACNWDTARFLIFSNNVFDPLIYYSHLTALILSLGFGLFIFWKSHRELLVKVLFLLTVTISLWLFGDLVIWATENHNFTMFFWSMVNLLEPFVYALSLYFIYIFINKKDTSFKTKLFIFAPLLVTILLTPTKLALLGFNASNCDRDAVEGLLVYYGYALEFIYIIWIIILASFKHKKATDEDDKKQISLISMGIVLFLLSFSFGNVIGSLFTDLNFLGSDYSWTVGQYGLFGVPIFIGFLSYLVVKFKTFDTKLISTQVLIYATWILVISILFINQVYLIHIIIIITFLFLLFLGSALIRSVKNEVRQKERLEDLSHKLADANVHLQDLDKLKTEFLSLASHQLRSPLTAIKGYTSMLLEGSFGEMTKDQKEAIDRVYQSSKHLTVVVEDLLNVSKIEQGGMQYVMDIFDLRKASYDLAMDLKVTAEKKGLVLTFTSDTEEPHLVYGDVEKVRQVLLNFIDNSIKYTAKGSIEVSVNARNEADNTRTMVFAVKDTGMGVSPETKAKLFQKFSRGEGGKVNTGGSGLGLYLAKEIVSAHHGKVDLQSEGEGKGSTFIVEMKETTVKPIEEEKKKPETTLNKVR